MIPLFVESWNSLFRERLCDHQESALDHTLRDALEVEYEEVTEDGEERQN